MADINNINDKGGEKKGFLDSISSFSLILIMVILTMIGIALVPMVKVSHKPTTEQGSRLSITCSWSGASPRVVEQEITSRIEGMVSSVSGVESVWSTSYVGRSYVGVQLKDGVNISSTRFEISSLLKQLSTKLPEDASYPWLNGGSVNTGETQVKQLLSYQINADMPQDQIQEYAQDNIAAYLEQIEGVSDVKVSGGMPQYLEIVYNPIMLGYYGLTAQNIVDGIYNFVGRSQILGDIEQIDKHGVKNRITLHLETSRIGYDIGKIPIANIDDKIVYLSSIATMSYKEKAPSSYYRVNGMNTVYLNVEVEEDVNIISMSKKVRAEMESLKENLVENYYVKLRRDAAKEISAELNKLVRRTFLALFILLFFVWLVSRSLRYLSIIAITLAANIFISVIMYYLFEIQLHIFSLAGISVAFGIVIDTSIVMVDHYSYYRNRKMFIAILAALLTTIGSLVIIFFMPDYIKEDLSDFSAIIIINLSVALLVSLFFVPALIDRYKYQSSEATKSISTRRKIVKFSHWYSKYIRYTQKRKWIYVTIMILAFGLPIHLLPSKVGEPDRWSRQEKIEKQWYHDVYNATIGSNLYQHTLKKSLEYTLGGALRLFSTKVSSFSRKKENKEVVLHIRSQMPEGGNAQQINDKIVKIESLLSKYSEIDRYETNINGRGGFIDVYFTEEAAETSFPYILESEVIAAALNVGGVDWSIYGVSEKGFSNSLNLTYKTHRIAITGYNYDQVYKIAERLCEKMAQNRRATDVEIQTSEQRWNSAPTDLNEMYIKYDMQKVALQELNLNKGYSALNGLLSTIDISKSKTGNIRTDITIVSSERDSFDVWNLLNSYVNVGDKQVKYSDLGTIGKRKARSSIQKRNQEYSINVAFNFLGSYELSDKFVEEVTEEMNAEIPIGFKCENSSSGWRRTNSSQYWLIFVIVAIIFFVCSILFESLVQPLMIITLIPISFIGTFLTFYFLEIEFGTGGFASLVLLSGLVVNAAIYIINEYNNTGKIFINRAARNNSKQQMILNRNRLYLKAYNHKIIPVFLTIFSTVLGLIPFLLDGTTEQFWFSFAIGAIGGLLFSIVAILLFMPIFLPLKDKRLIP
ncbi:MAG: efflux RND transporter permease subunit [Rikenellaceae bacterium]